MRGAAVLALAQPLTWAATLLFVALAPHYLGARGFGAYAVATNAATIIGALVALGVPTYLTRHLAAAPDDRETISAALLLSLGGAGLAGLIFSQLYALSGAKPHDLEIARLALAGMAVAAGQSVLYASLNGRGRHGRYAALNIVWSLAVVASQTSVLALGGGLRMMFVVGLLVTAAIFLLTWLLAGRPGPRARLSIVRRVAAGSMPFFAWDVVLRLRAQVDVVLVQLLAQATAAGQLAAAYQIIGIPVFIPTLIVTPLLPALADPRVDRRAFRATLERSLLAVLVFTLPLSAGIVALAPHVPSLLHWPRDFGGAVLAMRLLVPEPPLVAVDMVLGAAVVALRRERAWLLAAVAAAAFNILGNLVALRLLAHALGNTAAAAALVEDGTELIMLCAAVALIPRDLLGAKVLWQGARLLIASVAVALVAGVLAGRALPLAIVAGGVVYVLALPLLRVLGPADVRCALGLIAPRLIRGRVRARAGQPAVVAADNCNETCARVRSPRWQPPRGGSAAARAAALVRADGGLGG
jgi:O-antigen/teichoic acid export membrane protein